MPTETITHEKARACPHCCGPMSEYIHQKRMKDRAGEPHTVAEAATFTCEWCEHRLYD